jgi:hypothetical protein
MPALTDDWAAVAEACGLEAFAGMVGHPVVVGLGVAAVCA